MALPSSLLTQGGYSVLFSSSNQVSEANCRIVVTSGKRSLVRCLAKKKISFVDQILDYIEGGPKLRKWYGAPELLPKDGSSSGEDDEAEEQEDNGDGDKDTVFVTDGDSDVGQMIILQLIVKGTRVKALVKDKRKAMEAFGAYVELASGDASDERFLKKSFRGVGAIISPTEGFLSNVKSLKGVKHVVLLSQLSVYESSGGIEAMMNSKAKKLAEGDEKAVISSNVPYTIIRTGKLENSPGGNQGFNFITGAAAKGSLSKEDAARICIEALSVIPPTGLIFEVSNGEDVVSDWEGQLMKLMSQKK
ncbi:NAD(P)-bd_dom domain-containing protein [Hirschfeldia incana]|nr:NAD(P)-bd_dom domain-containing protein [Hirschfeldia incana]